MKKGLIILLILIVLFVGIKEQFSIRKHKKIWKKKYNNRYNRNRRRFFNNYRNRYFHYYPTLYPNLRTNCRWIKVCDDDWYYYY